MRSNHSILEPAVVVRPPSNQRGRNRSSSRRRKDKPMRQTTALPEQSKSQQIGKTEVSQAQPTVGRFAEIPYDQFTPEQQEAYRSLIDAEGLEPAAALPSAPLKIWINNPKLSKAVASLICHLRFPHNSLSQRERELAVCILTSKW